MAVLQADNVGHASDPVSAWRNPGAGETDPRRFALAHAILAPNPHNRQPWRVDLIGADALTLRIDPTRVLPETDPFDRQITLGCGSFLELLSIAAAERGLATDVSPFPEGSPTPRLDSRPIAQVRFRSGAAPDPLFAAIPKRRTNREAYLAEAPSTQEIEALARTVRSPDISIEWVTAGNKREALRELVGQGFDHEVHTPHAYLETVRLLRVGRSEIERNRDGLTLEGWLIEAAKAVGLLTRTTLTNPDHWLTKPSIKQMLKLAEECPAFIWIKTPDNERVTQLAAGRAYARLNLAANAQGLAMHPWSQTLQEYPEMADLFGRMRALTGAQPEETVQMLVRVGYGPEIKPAPRRELDKMIAEGIPSETDRT